ncbi:MAG: hypothetical protein ACRYF4_11610 [Janthinobacterium lividum]
MDAITTTQAAGKQIATAPAASPKLVSAAKQFESVLLGQWLQEAESSFASVPGGDEDTDSGGQQMQGFATQQLATGLTASGGIGIAKLVQGALARASAREEAHAGATPGTALKSDVAAATHATNSASAMAAYAAETRR